MQRCGLCNSYPSSLMIRLIKSILQPAYSLTSHIMMELLKQGTCLFSFFYKAISMMYNVR